MGFADIFSRRVQGGSREMIEGEENIQIGGGWTGGKDRIREQKLGRRKVDKR